MIILVKNKEKHYRESGLLLFTMLETLNSLLHMKPNRAKNQLWINDICSRVYEMAIYNMRRVCDTIKKYNVKKSPYIWIRLYTAKKNEELKQDAYVNYTLNEFKKLSKILGDFLFVDNCKPQ